MAVLDHIHMGSANIYASVHKLAQESKLGHYDGGFLNGSFFGGRLIGTTLGHKAVPLGNGVYIEVVGVVDPYAVSPDREPFYVKKAHQFGTEVFSGYTVRVDTMDELREIAKRIGGEITRIPVGRVRPDGPQIRVWGAYALIGPHREYVWEHGLPDFACWEDRMYCHPAGQPVVNAPGLVEPQGVTWMEVGGTEADMRKWLGQAPSDFGMRFNGKAPGLYALGVKTDQGEVVLRRPSASQTSL